MERNYELEKYMYKHVMDKFYPDGLICLDEEKNLFTKVKPYSELSNEEATTFVLFSSIAMDYFDTLKRKEKTEKIEDDDR